MLSSEVWAGISGILAIFSIVLSILLFQVAQKQEIAEIEYWTRDHLSPMKLPSGEMSEPTEHGKFIGIRNNGPANAEDVLVTVQSGNLIDCTEVGTGIMFAETVKPTRSSSSPYYCEYYYDFLYSNYAVFFIVDRSTDTHSFSISITGNNVEVIQSSSE